MFGKYMKYEMKSMGRILLPLYIALVVAAIVFSFNIKLTMNRTVAGILEHFAIITSILFICMVIAVFIVTVFLILQRFYRNLLGNEGYLMFTLPVNTFTHIAGKALSSMIWIFAGVIAGGVAGIISVSIFSSVPEFLRELREAWDVLVQNGLAVRNITMIIIMLVLGILESILKVYASMSVGHQWNGHRLLGSVFAYVGFSIIEGVLSTLFARAMNGMGFGSLGMIQVSSSGEILMPNVVRFSLIVTAVQILVYGYITWYLLDRRLNLE